MKARSPFVSSEDWWSVYIGILLTALVTVAFLAGAPLDLLKRALPPAWPQKPLLAGVGGAWSGYLLVYLLIAGLTAAGVKLGGGRLRRFLPAFTILFGGSFLILVVGSHQTLKLYGLEYPFWALIVGLAIGNLVRLPAWFESASRRTELFIKTGIVLLGASLPFTIILQGGLWGFLEALIIVTVGFCVAFAVARALGFDRRFAAVLGAGSSVCGVSAAIAVGSAVNAEERQVGYVVSLVVLFALVLIFLIPILGRLLRLTEVVIGAWIGGSELADAAGLAAAAIVGERAVSAFSLVKLNRDVFIGLLTFVFASIAVTRWERATNGVRPSARIIWDRFPKFVLAFLFSSIVVTILVARFGKAAVDAHVTALLAALRTWLFTLTFLCIGLNTRFREIGSLGRRPIIAFATVVVVNLLLGLLLAQLFFGGWIARPLG